MFTLRLLPYYLLIIACTLACTSTGELTQEDINLIWAPDPSFFDADLTVDAKSGRYEFDTRAVSLQKSEQGNEIIGRQSWSRFTKEGPYRIPWKDVSRLWYDVDLVLYLQNGRKLELNAGQWYMAVENEQVIALVSVLAQEDSVGVYIPVEEKWFPSEKVAHMELGVSTDWIPTIGLTLGLILVGLFTAGIYLAIASSP